MTNRSRQATDAVGERFVVISGCSGGGKSALLTEFGLTIEHTLTVLHQSHRYHWRVFLTPPWAELYLNDDACRHDFNAAIEEYHRLLEVYPELGYEVYRLPKIGISERADYGLQLLGSSPD